MEVARWFAAEGVPAYVVYYDDAGWHMAGPPMPGPVLAEGFRKLADQCEQQLAPEVVN